MRNSKDGLWTMDHGLWTRRLGILCFILFLVHGPWSIVYSPSALAAEYDSQIAEQKAIIAKDPTNLDATYQMGNLLAWDGKYDEAILVYKAVLAREPAYEEAEIGIARALAWKGEQGEAIKKYEAILSKNPENFEAYEGLGSLALWTNDFEKSIDYFKKSLELNPRDIISLKGIGRAYLGRGDRRTAEDYFTKAEILEIRQTPVGTILLIVGGFFVIALMILFLIRTGIRKKKEIFLRMELKIVRTALALYQQKNSKFPLVLENLMQEKWRPVSENRERPYLDGVQRGDRGFLVDPFGNHYWYNPDTGKVSSTTKGCEEW